MNEEQLSAIRSDILATNPDIPKDQLTDEKLAAAVERAGIKSGKAITENGQAPASPTSEQGSLTGSAATLEAPGDVLETGVELGNSGADNLNLILAELQGNSARISTDSKTLGKDVSQMLGL